MGEWDRQDANANAGTQISEGNAQIEETLDRARAELERYTEVAADFIRERPVVAVAGAVAIGFLIGKLVSRR